MHIYTSCSLTENHKHIDNKWNTCKKKNMEETLSPVCIHGQIVLYELSVYIQFMTTSSHIKETSVNDKSPDTTVHYTHLSSLYSQSKPRPSSCQVSHLEGSSFLGSTCCFWVSVVQYDSLGTILHFRQCYTQVYNLNKKQ